MSEQYQVSIVISLCSIVMTVMIIAFNAPGYWLLASLSVGFIGFWLAIRTKPLFPKPNDHKE
jgi:hypothetical protein